VPAGRSANGESAGNTPRQRLRELDVVIDLDGTRPDGSQTY
jgi:hypothetical protein